jgi:hypothetical protein
MMQSWERAAWSGLARVREADDVPPHDHGWIVEIATRRVIRRRCPACVLEAAEALRLEHQATRAGAEGREAMKVLKQIEEALEEGAEVLEPAESDLRIVEPEEIHPAPPVHSRRGRDRLPASVEERPTPRELGREHRGY